LADAADIGLEAGEEGIADPPCGLVEPWIRRPACHSIDPAGVSRRYLWGK
jgi:hypothetical protein